NRAHRQGGRRAMLRVHRRLHALLPAGRRRRPWAADRRALPGAPRRWHRLPDSLLHSTTIHGVTLVEQVRADVNQAMKSAQRDRAAALRVVLSELQKAAKEGGADELAV